MHYKDGQEVFKCDIVRGAGCGFGYEIQGIVTGGYPGAQSCNVVVSHLVTSGAAVVVEGAVKAVVTVGTTCTTCNAGDLSLVHRPEWAFPLT